MRTNPLFDTLLFLIGYDGSYKPLGIGQYPLIVLFDVLVAANLCLVAVNWRDDPTQRRARCVYIWIARSLIAGMWFQGSLWKLPLPVSGGFTYWMQESAKNAAFPAMANFYAQVLLPHIAVINIVAYVAELGFAISLMLGFVCRLGAVAAMAYSANIFLGLYHKGSEWPWQYMFLILLMGYFAVDPAGRSLGLDALLHRRAPAGGRRSLAGRVYGVLS